MTTNISIVLITKNEEARLARCLESARWADEIIVVDAHSGDSTAAIAEQHGAKVLLRKFENFADQKNFAIAQATKPWVFSLDADEVVPELLRDELCRRAQDPKAVAGYYVLRDNYFFGRCLRYGGQGQDKQMRLFRAGHARFKNVVHEEVEIDGTTGLLESRLAHYSCDNINQYLRKMMHYTDLEVPRMREKGICFSLVDLLVRPCLRFSYTYVWKRGFLDGYEGFLYHAFSAFYAFVKIAKLKENRGDK